MAKRGKMVDTSVPEQEEEEKGLQKVKAAKDSQRDDDFRANRVARSTPGVGWSRS